MPDIKNKNEKSDQAWWQPALVMFAHMSAWIAAPVVLASFLGKWLDTRFSTEPWLFLSCVFFSFLISMFGLIWISVKEFKKIENQDSLKISNNQDNGPKSNN